MLFLAAIVVFYPRVAHSQQVSGTITGYVTDPSGAGIPGAAVTVTGTQTGVSTRKKTDASGLYVVTNLIPGTYSVSVVATGFRTFVRQNVVLSVDATVTVNATMQLGQVSQQVTVSGAPPVLNLQKADVSATLPARAVESLPTLSRNVSSLVVLAPGVTQNSYQQGVSEQPANGFEATANGQFWGVNNYQLDGISDTQTGLSGYQILVPPADGIQEMKVTTADYDAELGQVAGMVVQYSTKSGTNQFHGSAYEFNRNRATFAANPYTEKIPGTGPKGLGTGPSPYNENTFGGSFGGPIKKDKLFFFADYQGDYIAQSSAFLGTVPNTDFQAGNLTAALGSNLCFNPSNPASNGACGGSFTSPLMVPTTEGGMIQAQQNMIFDPATGNPDGSGRQAFTVGGAPNMIPSSRFNSVSGNLLSLLNQNLGRGVVNQALTNNNFSTVVPGQFHTNEWDGRVDLNISQKDRMFFRYSLMNALLNDPPILGLAGGPSAIGSEGEIGHYRNQLGALNLTHAFSPTLVAEFRFGITRFALTGYQYDVGHNTDDQVGILGINTNSALYQGLAGITVGGPAGGFTMGDPSGQGLPRLNYDTTFEWDNNWNKMAGRHQFRWGIDVIRERENFLTVNESSRGNFQFNQDITSDNGIPGTGLGMGTFLLGLPSEFDRAVFSQLPAERDWRIAPYFEDDLHVTPNLTLNLGLRYDYIGPSTPAFPGGGVNFDPVSGNLVLGCLGQVSCSENVKPNYKNFEPRVGFAYKVLSKTVIRAGFGRSYFSAQYGGGIFGTMCCSYPVQTRQDLNQPSNYFPIVFPGQTAGYALNSNQPLPPAPLPVFPSNGLIPIKTVPGLGAFAVPFNNPTPYIDSWNFSVQQELKPNLSLSVAYVGNVGRHNYGSWDLNAPIPGPGPLTSREPLYNSLGVDWRGLSERCNCQSSSYNGLQTVLAKRFTGDYSIQSAFSWSKALDLPYGGFSSGPLNPYNRAASRAPDYNNRALVWNVSHEWILPYGKGHRYGSTASAAKQAVLGGWVFNGITTLMSGLPTFISWSDTSSLNNGGDFGQRPDLVGNPLQNIPAGLWYNPAAFANPAPYNFGNADRVVVGPHFFGANWGLWKEFRIKERADLEVRFESFNLFNNTNRSNPDGTANNSTAGLITNIITPMRQFQFGARLRW
ncbi:MAG TPA: TonB-dependent receptor [Terriglobia bacterium]|nr:TonB-dependent receptor [Terriglobia bacterium]